MPVPTKKKSVEPKPEPPARKPWYAMDAHHRFFVSVLAAVVTLVALHGRVAFPTLLVLTWDAFALSAVTMSWAVIVTQDPYEVRQNVRLQDASATFLFVAVIFAAMASLLAVGVLLGPAKNLPPARLAEYLALSVGAVVFSWFLVHTLFTLRYAHAYFRDARQKKRDQVAGGLIFPGGGDPGYLDFAYFSFVIGMTCQVSDVQISSRSMRRLALVHGLISFAFNTAILAMFVNIIAGIV